MKDSFKEIIGYEDIKKELRIISDMLNNPEIYRKLGAEINEGLILSGEPGTGKTTMANCLIKSTGRKAYTIRKKSSDGDFIKTIENTFEEAKQNAPSIVFIDDMDKFSEKEAKVDSEEFVAIQSCMDEIKGADVFVIATANNNKKIPDSLLRAGRLGKRLKVRAPKKDEAADIIKHYLDKAGMKGLDELSIARMLDGETCATLENVINNASIKAVFNRQKKVTMQNIIDSCLDLIFDSPESFDSFPEDYKKKIAYHEAGHALVSELLDPGSVCIISIRKNSDSDYGFVSYYRDEDKENFSSEYRESIIKTSLAGRAAIDLVFGEPDMGIITDIRKAYRKVDNMVDDLAMYGFSNFVYSDIDDFSAENRNRTDAVMLEKYYLEVKKLIADHRDMLERLANELMKKTTLIYSDIRDILYKPNA